MPKIISEAMNTYNPCLAVLVKMGFRITADFPEEGASDWTAENGKVRLSASSPVALLGLASLWEVRGESWGKKSDETDLYNQLLEGNSVP